MLPALYDDGGVSGGTMERPALTRLLADVAAGLVDTVVIYKVDRLTRSLGDFAKIVEVLDRAGVSFVSVTQQFNTTTSMGRLTLNMLLSFAQFEREVTGERIRDKIAASKKKGMWMGGCVPLGYDVRDRNLVVNEPEADSIREIYRLYAELGSVQALRQELHSRGITGKQRINRFGRTTGGTSLGRGALYLILQNQLYRGIVVHKGQSHPGEHAAIVDEELWEQVQARRAANRVTRRVGSDAIEPSLLAGLLHDADGDRLTPTHATKQGRRYRHYVSHRLVVPKRKTDSTSPAPTGRRLPAHDIEAIVERRLCSFLADEAQLYTLAQDFADDASERQRLVSQATSLAQRWSTLDGSARRGYLQQLIARIVVHDDRVDIAIRPAAVAAVDTPFSSNDERPPLILSIPAKLKRAGLQTRILVDADAGAARTPDRSLLRLLAQAQRFQAMVLRGDGRSISDFAAEAGVTRSYFTRILRLSFLAPDVIRAILDGRQPHALSAQRLSRQQQLPREWDDQASLLLAA